MVKAAELWTLAQAHTWVALVSSDLLSPDERAALIRDVGPDFEAKGRTREWAYARANRFPRLRHDDERGNEAADMAQARKNRELLSVLWNEAESAILREVRSAQISIFARLNQPSSDLVPLTRLELDGIQFGQDGTNHDLARRPNDRDWRWRSIRFEAAEIVEKWPNQTPHASEPAQAKRPVAFDQALRILQEIADPKKKKLELQKELRERFPGAHISDDNFQKLYDRLPRNLKRMRGETDKARQRRDNEARQ